MCHFRPQTNTNVAPGEVVSGGIGSAESTVGLGILEGFSWFCKFINFGVLKQR